MRTIYLRVQCTTWFDPLTTCSPTLPPSVEEIGPRELESDLQATQHWWQRWDSNLRFRTFKGSDAHIPRHDPTLTLAGAEAELAVCVIVGGGAAPRIAVGATVCGAGRVGVALKGEGEVTGGSVCVSKVGRNHCGKKRTRVRTAA